MKTPKKAQTKTPPAVKAPAAKKAPSGKLTPAKLSTPKPARDGALCSYCGAQPIASRDDAVSKRLLVYLEENAPSFQITWCQGCGVERVEALGRVESTQEAFKGATKNFWTLMLPGAK